MTNSIKTLKKNGPHQKNLQKKKKGNSFTMEWKGLVIHIEYCLHLSKFKDEQFQQGIPVKRRLATDT